MHLAHCADVAAKSTQTQASIKAVEIDGSIANSIAEPYTNRAFTGLVDLSSHHPHGW